MKEEEVIKKHKLLIVDDIFTNRFLVSEIVREIGFEVVEACNGKEAIDIIHTIHLDLILMDIEMPVMNGIETTHYIRHNLSSPKCDIPIIALTAHNPLLFFDDYRDAGFSQIITKPYTIKRFKEVINLIMHGITKKC